ncbi:hypothetical protein POJ06DRAFT_259615 [Lipomyces tetrasporus]|uniref:Uncharacterized protein n=1 Tax=Lipomyces tetrasporus TaxID=54092 RepID=A0AAD7QNI8_9ASCO|nr:uncharacterized protein POJ06DRAFT_259615 [Lipomyces tetrasporus]KAJ8098491.1 hypothetical protein POJ06DRAFT_259615 [Lipomyces tetrasporus]
MLVGSSSVFFRLCQCVFCFLSLVPLASASLVLLALASLAFSLLLSLSHNLVTYFCCSRSDINRGGLPHRPAIC